ncbi:MAG: 30S ribosome-binding factor RbfA [Bryobacterales bacterium]|nr:30S ribosome-binding factor RbfA [Bryobacteraceae bacterium]MDW8129919.1 30S ribosome-binding factor RbfA [Bryobacterales bacterium]
MHARRAARVAEALRQELAELIGYEMTDPRVAGVTVTRVAVSRDLRRADVRVEAPGGEAGREAALRALKGARHWLRREVAGRLRIWRIPEFHFQADSDRRKTQAQPAERANLSGSE